MQRPGTFQDGAEYCRTITSKRMNDRRSVLQRCKSQVTTAIARGNKSEELSAQDNLGQVYISLGQFEEAIKCHTKVASLAVDLQLSIPQGRAYYKIAHENSSLGNYRQAIDYYEKCLSVLQGKGDSMVERMAYCNLGSSYFVSGKTELDYMKSLKYLERSLSMAVEANDSGVEANACHNLGNSNMALGKYQEAISYYERSLLADSERNSGLTYRLMGKANVGLKKYKEAIRFEQKSLDYATSHADQDGQKVAYLEMGSIFHEMGQYHDAVEHFQKYLNVAKELEDRRAMVEAYRFIGNANIELKRNQEALDSYMRSLDAAIEIGDEYGEECALVNTGLAYDKLEKYQEAIDCFEKRLSIAVQKLDRKAEGEASLRIANAYAGLRNYDEAITYHKRNLDIVKEIGEANEVASAYSNIASAYSSLSDFKEALNYGEKFLNASVQMGDIEMQSKAYQTMGILYGQLNRYKESMSCFEKELQIVVEKGDVLKEAKVYCHLGNVYVATGNYEEAFKGYEKCLAIALENDDKDLLENTYCNMGNAYFELGDKVQAHRNFKESAEIAISTGNRAAAARGYCRLSRVATNCDDFQTALDYAKKHLDIVEVLGNKHTQVFAYYDVGRNFFHLGQYLDAKSYLEKSANLANEIGNKKDEAAAYQYLGYVNQDYFRDYPMAIDCYSKQLNLSKEIGEKRGAGQACRNLGTVYLFKFLNDKSSENKEKSEAFLKESLKWYDLLFQDIGEQDQHKINVVDTFIYSNKLLVELYIEAQQPERALLVSEEERGRALEDLLRKKYKVEKNVDTLYDFQGYMDIANKVLSPNSCIVFFSDLMKMSRSNFELQVGTWVLDLEHHVSFYRNELKDIKALLKEKSIDEEIKESKDILHDLVEKTFNTMCFRGEAAGSAENRSFTTNAIGWSGSDTGKRNVYIEKLNDNYFEVLFEALIAPIQKKLTYDEIVIIPEGPLFKIPFAALRDPTTNSYLSETKCIRIVPSLTTLKILRESSQESAHSMKGALIVGDPDVEGKRLFKGIERYFHQLPNARREAEEIAKILGVRALTGAQANKEVILQQLSEGVSVIHFAAHGCADSGEIILSPPESLKAAQTIPDEKDYLLTMNEVQRIGMRARLVVLSCCHSGRGEIKSEGVIGMSRAFLAAGALAVVASLWAVDDLGTRVFMKQFYAHLKEGKSASKSLQIAMKELREMVQYEDPSFWAPFILIGDDVTVNL